VKYFSGKGTYNQDNPGIGGLVKPGARLCSIWEGEESGGGSGQWQTVGIVWKTPFRVEVTDALKPATTVTPSQSQISGSIG